MVMRSWTLLSMIYQSKRREEEEWKVTQTYGEGRKAWLDLNIWLHSPPQWIETLLGTHNFCTPPLTATQRLLSVETKEPWEDVKPWPAQERVMWQKCIIYEDNIFFIFYNSWLPATCQIIIRITLVRSIYKKILLNALFKQHLIIGSSRPHQI